MIQFDLPVVISILVFIFLILAIFYNRFYKEAKNNKLTLISGPTKFNEEFEKSFKLHELLQNRKQFLLEDKGYGITLSWEMYIPNNNGSRFYNSGFNKLKNIVTIGESPQIYYHPKNGYLSFIFKYLDNPFYSHYPEIKLEDVPLQKWNKIILVIENRHVRVYLNGNLTRSITLPNVLILNFEEMNIGKRNNNFLGLIKNMSLYPFPMNNTEIKEIL
jgi:hypothetical protein